MKDLLAAICFINNSHDYFCDQVKVNINSLEFIAFKTSVTSGSYKELTASDSVHMNPVRVQRK